MKAQTEQKSHRKKQLTMRYMLAVTLVFILSLSSLIVLEYTLRLQEGYSSVINLSGRQRMLSQQIALLTHEILECTSTEEYGKLKEQFDRAVLLMETTHKHLISGKTGSSHSDYTLSKNLQKIYFQPPHDVDRLVNQYLRSIKKLLNQPFTQESHATLADLSIFARGPLLQALNSVVYEYERESNSYSQILKTCALVTFFLMIILLTGLIVFGFRPMVNVLVENENMLNSILDSTPILMDIVSMNGTILYQSKYLIDMQGTSAIGQKCFHAYTSGATHCDACPMATATPDLDQKVIAFFDKIGTGIIVEISHLYIIFKGEKALLHTFQDITEQRRTEAYLIKAKEEADQASMAKSRFLANISHEIRTPMNAIIGFSDLTLETALNSRQAEYLNNIKSSSNSLLKIIDQILFYSNLDTGKISLQEEEFSVKDIFENLLLLFEERAGKKNISLLVQLDPAIPAPLYGDGKQLHLILLQLVTNSLTFTEHGSIVISATLTQLSEQTAHIEFAVSDTGIGMSTLQQNTLFDTFSQADDSSTRKIGGTGLGLAICKQQVELLGGELLVDSKIDQGSTFSFSISFTAAAGEKHNRDRKKPAPPAGIKSDSTQSLRLEESGILQQQARKEAPLPRDSASTEEVTVALQKLSEMLAANHFSSIEQWNRLKKILPRHKSSTLEKLDDHISKYEFKEASELLAKVSLQLHNNTSGHKS